MKFRPLRKDELRPGHESGITYTSVCIDSAVYLAWLKSQCLKNGVKFHRAVLTHLSQAVSEALRPHNIHGKKVSSKIQKVDVIVNCTGLGARFLGGVEDSNMIPARGQTVLVRNEADEMCFSSGTDGGDEEVCYVMQRASGTFSGARYYFPFSILNLSNCLLFIL